MLRKIWFQTHWLIGITAGIILALVGATGAMLSFEDDILLWLNRDVRTVSPLPDGPLAPPELLARLRAGHPERTITELAVSNDPYDAARVTFALLDANRAGAGRRRGEAHYVNPYTAEVIEGEGTKGETFFRTTMQVHRWLTAGEWGDRDVGKQIVGMSTALLLVLALSGLYLRWPRRARDWRAWLTFNVALKGRSFLWHLHAVAGTWVLVFYLLMAATGLYWSYDWYRGALYAVTGAEPRVRGGAARDTQDGTHTADLTRAWAAFLRETADSGYSEANIRLPPSEGSIDIRYLDSEPAHERASNLVKIDADSAAILNHERYAEKPVGDKIMSSIFPLHSGSFFGLPGRITFMLASLTMPLFAITGWMLYLKRRKEKKAVRAARAAARRRALAEREPFAVKEPNLAD